MCNKSMALGETVRDIQQQWETVENMQNLHGTRETVRDSQQLWETVRDI